MKDLERLTHLIIQFFEKMASWENSVVKGSGLSPAQMHTIEIIGVNQGLRMKELAEKMGITTGTLTVMIDRLEKKGLVERLPNQKDRRSYLVHLTSKGQELFHQHHQHHLRLTEEALSGMSPEEKQDFSRLLEKFISQL
ncbi:MarR family winged helix-turn-helix transcriptional regulator [Thermosulfuriphilus sp.]